jgi:hypothetical protein
MYYTTLQKEEGADHLRNSVIYDDDGVVRVLRGIQSFLACMLPIAGIVVLYVVQDMAARIGVLAGMTAIFSLTLCFLTNASVKDIFGTTAAYDVPITMPCLDLLVDFSRFSAVLVVFVGATVNA